MACIQIRQGQALSRAAFTLHTLMFYRIQVGCNKKATCISLSSDYYSPPKQLQTIKYINKGIKS